MSTLFLILIWADQCSNTKAFPFLPSFPLSPSSSSLAAIIALHNFNIGWHIKLKLADAVLVRKAGALFWSKRW